MTTNSPIRKSDICIKFLGAKPFFGGFLKLKRIEYFSMLSIS